MKYTFFLKSALLLLFCFFRAEATTYSSYSGRNFYVSFMQNEIHLNKDPLVLKVFLTSLNPTTYEIILPNETFRGELRANEIKEVDIPTNLEVTTSEVPQKLAVQIKSEQPISVYCFSSKLTTSDSYSAIPVSRWGTKYIVASYPNDQYASPDRENLDSLTKFVPRSSQFMIISAYDGTVINFAPKANTRAGKLAGSNYQITLNRGEVYLVQSYPYPRGFGDLTGTIVTGNKPFGLLSGHVRTAIPQTAPYPFDSKDHLVEMLPPTNTWGKNFISIPFGVNTKGDLFRLIALEDGTIVEMKRPDGTVSYLPINAPGAFQEVRNLNTPIIWSSNKPIQIVQYMQHTGEFGDSKEYDPSMVVLPPLEQFVNDILFLTPRNYRVEDQFKEHRVGLVFENSALSTLALDGQNITALWDVTIQSIPNTDYSWTSIRLREGRHQLKSLTGKFSGILYAYGFHDSYAMSLGNSLVDPINPDTIPPNINVTENCGIIHGSVSDFHNKNDLGLDYAYVVPEFTTNYAWNISEISDTAFFATFSAHPIDITKDARITIDFFDKASNRSRYTFQYYGTKINHINSLSYPNTALTGQDCHAFLVTNNSNKVIELLDINIDSDERISWRTDKQLPFKLNPNEKINVQVCFTPNGDSSALDANLILQYDCNYTTNVKLDGRVFAPQFELFGWDFGKVRLGETTEGYVRLVNTGNTNIIINNIQGFEPYTDFKLEAITYPITLTPREERTYKVLFTPTARFLYDFMITAFNDFGLKSQATIAGEGVAPEVNSLKIDFGRKRVGTTNSLSDVLKNSGNDTTRLALQSLVGNLDDGNLSLIQSLNGRTLQVGEQITLDFEFNPTSTSDFATQAEFLCDWSLHPPITIELQGVGTLPQITTFNHRFDTTLVLKPVDSLLLVISAAGNEELTIDSINILGGDITSFIFNKSEFHNLKLTPGENKFINVQFLPHWAGEHQLSFEVISDALPNYERKRDTVVLSGFALPNDTLDYEMLVQFDNLHACKLASGNIFIKNKGNINLNIQSIIVNLSQNNFILSFNTDLASILPFKLPPDSSLTIPISLYAERNTGGSATFEIIFNDSLSEILQIDIYPFVYEIELIEANPLRVTPGDTVSLHIHGRFPYGIDTKIAPKIYLNIDRFLLDLISNSTKFLLKNSTSELEIIAQVQKNKNRIDLALSVDSLIITEQTDFYFTLQFIGLLNKEDSTNIKLELNADNCFEPLVSPIPVKIINVCNFPLRPIKLITNLPYLTITPNPILDDIIVELYLVEDDEISLYLADMQGKVINLEQGKALTKGKHILKYNTQNFSTGVYNLICVSKQIKKNIIFIKTK